MSVVAKKAPARLVVLGSGWGSFSLLKNIDASKFSVSVVSPRDHMLFTPLLASTTVGTLEHRSVIEPLRPLTTKRGFVFYQGEAISVDPKKKEVTVRKAVYDALRDQDRKLSLKGVKDQFTVPYDALVVGVGAVPNTFDIPGAKENSFFLKEARDGQKIRARIHDCFEAASYPTTDDEDNSLQTRKALLTFCVVGGGPTGCEFAAELKDFIEQDVSRQYPNVFQGGTNLWPRVILLEASGELLGAFDQNLRQYALRRLHKSGNCEVRLGTAVERVDPGVITVKGGEQIPCGLIVWSTGVGPRKFITKGMDWADKIQGGRLSIDEHLRVKDGKAERSIYAIGDCAGIEGRPLPAIAQVAEQEGTYLAKVLNEYGVHGPDKLAKFGNFTFKTKGMLAYLGGYSGVASVVTGTENGSGGHMRMKGTMAWLLWRGAYLSKLGSWRNRLQVPVDWMKTILFGRDSSRF